VGKGSRSSIPGLKGGIYLMPAKKKAAKKKASKKKK
jgi:predicted small lipoprotein YifL